MDLHFTVLQWGARLHYATPAALEQAGMLRAVYTDATDGVLEGWTGKVAEYILGSRANRLKARSIPDVIPSDKVHSYPRYNAQEEVVNLLRNDHRAEINDRFRIGSHGLGRKVVRDEFAEGNAFYVHACNGTEAIREAKKNGLFVVLEAVSMPYHKYIEKEEYERHGLSHPDPEEEIESNIDFFRSEALMADLVIAASTHVEEGLHRLGVPTSNTAVVPYGIEENFYDKPSTPEPGRVLFVGHVNYLKGVPYLAQAANILEERGVECEVRIVGGYDEKVIERPEFDGPKYVGLLSRDDVREDFLKADVFVFPTLSDGFGIVLAEAAAAGLPIISTGNCGDVVAHEENGYIVPSRDPKTLAERIQHIVQDRALRSRMGMSSLNRFRKIFTLDQYAQNIKQVIQDRYNNWIN